MALALPGPGWLNCSHPGDRSSPKTGGIPYGPSLNILPSGARFVFSSSPTGMGGSGGSDPPIPGGISGMTGRPGIGGNSSPGGTFSAFPNCKESMPLIFGISDVVSFSTSSIIF